MNTSDDRPMPAAHRVRLNSQWDFEPLSGRQPACGELPGAQRLKHLSDYIRAAAEFPGRIRLVRRFGRPTGLTPNDRLELVIQRLPSAMTILLNDQPLKALPIAAGAGPTDAPIFARFDVLGLLRARNRLAIEFDVSDNSDAAGVVRDVRLEIFVGDEVAR